MNRLIFGTLPLFVTLSVSALAASSPSDGPTLYKANCAVCHGVKGQGGIGPSLNDSATWSSALFSRAMLKGLNDHGKAFKAPMPTFGKVGFAGASKKAPTKAQIKALQAYLKALKPTPKGSS